MKVGAIEEGPLVGHVDGMFVLILDGDEDSCNVEPCGVADGLLVGEASGSFDVILNGGKLGGCNVVGLRDGGGMLSGLWSCSVGETDGSIGSDDIFGSSLVSLSASERVDSSLLSVKINTRTHVLTAIPIIKAITATRFHALRCLTGGFAIDSSSLGPGSPNIPSVSFVVERGKGKCTSSIGRPSSKAPPQNKSLLASTEVEELNSTLPWSKSSILF